MTETFPSPLDGPALTATWETAWASLGRPAPEGLHALLMAAWGEPQRHYHDTRHLGECLALWSRWCPPRGGAGRGEGTGTGTGTGKVAGEIAIALWFHDAIYDPQASSGSNELASAAWAARSLVRAGVDSDTAQRVHDLVMATRHDALVDEDQNPHAQLLLDIDLAILGSPAERFERYDQDVRKEYAWVPAGRYQQGRAQVLQSFLDRPQLYRTEAAFEMLEAQARINLAAALSRLVL